MEFAQAINSGSRVSSWPSRLNDGETGVDVTPLSCSRRRFGDMKQKGSGKKEIEYPERNSGFLCLKLNYYHKRSKVCVVPFEKCKYQVD